MVVWNKTYSVGVEIIDIQHKKFIDTLNKFYKPVEPQKKLERLEEIFSDLENYSRFHFATEEKYFKQFDYEGAAEHIIKHNEFNQLLSNFKTRLGEEGIANELADFLENWLTDHVLTMDKHYMKCFHDNGLK
jgi:hemerythrin